MDVDINSHDWKSRIVVGAAVGDPGPPSWLEESYSTFRERVTDPWFPCYFASDGERNGRLFYSHVSGLDVQYLPQTITTFLGQCSDLSRAKNNLTVFFEPLHRQAPHTEYRKIFWDTLCYLRDHDPQPKRGVQRDPSDPLWEFSFAGNLFFVVGLSPTYSRRRSRNLGPGMIMVFQPRQVFQDPLTGRDISAESRATIRDRLARWDGIGPHPDLNIYGEIGNLEWVQYFLSDNDTRETGRCPLSVRARSDVAAGSVDANAAKQAQLTDRN